MKVYIASGTFRRIVDTNMNKKQITIKTFLDHLKGNEVLDEFTYVDERGCRDYISAAKGTVVFDTGDLLEECNEILEASDDEDFYE
tara:strand:- start:50 stop:307 length:258 start_codon:yes stop_codon:yes gene_type:complete